MASILQELRSMKTDVAELQELWQEEQLDQEDGGVPLPSILEQPTIIQDASKVQESEATTQEECHELQPFNWHQELTLPNPIEYVAVKMSSVTEETRNMKSYLKGVRPELSITMDQNQAVKVNAQISSRVYGYLSFEILRRLLGVSHNAPSSVEPTASLSTPTFFLHLNSFSSWLSLFVLALLFMNSRE